MMHVKTSSVIDLSNWGAFNLHPKLGMRITELLRSEFADQPPSMHFPFQFSIFGRPSDGHKGPPVDDPVTLYVELPLGANEDSCVYACSLEAVIDDLVDGNSSDGTIEDAEAQEMCSKISARLRALADKLDKACAQATTTP